MLLTGHMTLTLFVVTEAIFGMASAFFGPASDGLVPQTVPPEELRPANALLTMSRNTLYVFGPALSGVLVASAGPGWVFLVDAASFAASAAFLSRLRVDAPARDDRPAFLRDVREGFREVVARDWVRAPIVGFAISNFTLASFIVLGPLVFLHHFDSPKSEWGIVSGVGSAGAIVGAVASVKLSPRHPLYAGFVASTLIAVPMAALAGPLPFPAVAAAWGVGMAGVSLSNTWWETTLQRGIPERVYARVRSYDILVSFVFMPIGMVAFGPIAAIFGVEWTLLAAAAVAAATNVVVAFAPGVRAISALPVPASCSAGGSPGLAQPDPLP
jgi:MFS family permease